MSLFGRALDQSELFNLSILASIRRQGSHENIGKRVSPSRIPIKRFVTHFFSTRLSLQPLFLMIVAEVVVVVTAPLPSLEVTTVTTPDGTETVTYMVELG